MMQPGPNKDLMCGSQFPCLRNDEDDWKRDNGKEKERERLWPKVWGWGGGSELGEQQDRAQRKSWAWFIELVLFMLQTGGYRTK